MLRPVDYYLMEGEKRFRELAELLPQIVFETDTEGSFTFVNHVAYTSTGYTREDLDKGLNISHMFVPEDRDRLKESMRKILSGKNLGGNECTAQRKDGGTFPVMIHFRPIIREDKPVGLRGIVIDLTEQREMEEQLEESKRLAALGEVAAMVGHDLRNPLQAISTTTHFLKTKLGSTADKETMEMLRLIENEVASSSKMVGDLEDYSRAMKPGLANIDLKSLIADALSSVKIPKSIEVLNLTKDGTKVVADSEKLKRVFVNIIRNAIEAMPKGGRLTVASKESIDNIEVTFTDTGRGMSKVSMKNCWLPFYTTRERGIGLGLAICKRIVEMHGGSITAISEVGEGSTFMITLPLKPRKWVRQI